MGLPEFSNPLCKKNIVKLIEFCYNQFVQSRMKNYFPGCVKTVDDLKNFTLIYGHTNNQEELTSYYKKMLERDYKRLLARNVYISSIIIPLNFRIPNNYNIIFVYV